MPSKRNLFPAGLLLYAALFLVSGACGLVYEVVWERLLEIYFGVTTLSIALIVSAYMFGLGVGSLLGGQLTRRIAHPLVGYGLLEAGIGLFGFASLPLLSWIGQSLAGSSYPVVFLVSFAILLIPTALMGATLPFLSQSFVRRVDTSGQVVGLLYGINTLGAALGAVSAGYILIGRLGLDGSVALAAACNLIIAAAALILSAKMIKVEIPASGKPENTYTHTSSQEGWGYRAILTAAFLGGFLGLGYQMLWFRIINVAGKNTAYTFPSMLFVFLLGLAAGGYLFGSLADRSSRPVRLFCQVQLAIAVLVGVSFLVLYFTLNTPLERTLGIQFSKERLPEVPFFLNNGVYLFSHKLALDALFGVLVFPLLFILPGSLLMGGGLPILDRLAIESPGMAGRRVGDIYLANVLGSVCGTLVVNLVLLAYAGSEWTLKILAFMSLAFVLLYFSHDRASGWIGPSRAVSAALLGGGLLALVIILPGKGSLYEKIFWEVTGGPVTVTEGQGGLIAMQWKDETKMDPTALWISGEAHSMFPSNGVYESLALACASVNQPRRILVIGLGGGHTAFLLSQLPGVERISIVELEPDLAPFLKAHLGYISALFDDSKVRYIVDDGRRYLYAHPDETFDYIIIDPLYTHTAGSNNLYSRQAVQLYQDHLVQDGVLCLWKDEHYIVPRTVASVFPYVDEFDDQLVARKVPIRYDIAALNAYVEKFKPIAQASMSQASLARLEPIYIFSRYVRPAPQILDEERQRAALDDTRPYLEYYFLNAPASGLRQKLRNPAALFERLQGCDVACQAQIAAAAVP